MTKLGCFSALTKKKKKPKEVGGSPTKLGPVKSFETNTLPLKIEHSTESFALDDFKSSYLSIDVPLGVKKCSVGNVNVMGHNESPVWGEAAKFAYEAEDEHEDYSSLKKHFFDFDLQSHHVSSIGEERQVEDTKLNFSDALYTASESQKDDVDIEPSDPGIGKEKMWALSLHKRSCSNIEPREVYKKSIGQSQLLKSRSFEQLQELDVTVKNDGPRSPISVMSHRSADRVMLKKRSSSQVLPSGSTRLWWKLFLWSHRNLHKPWLTKPIIKVAFNLQGGYSSDTLEPDRHLEFDKMILPISCSKAVIANENDDQSWDGSNGVVSGVWPQKQWVAFSDESSSYVRVNDWVKDLDTPLPLLSNNHNGPAEEGIVFPPSPENDRLPTRSTSQLTRRPDINVSEEILHANNIVRSMNSSSTVAQISGVGLKVIPAISCFTSLRSINLSNNLIARITPGSLPKGLHSLNLSRNKIQTIEGLKELHRLRVLDLSYNRISRIGHGLSNCTVMKELYLGGNRISDVEGLHRLLKLKVLDLSFNKITSKAVGQLVANYNSMLALNIICNPIQNNIGEEQMRKAVSGLLPKLVYLNKQAMKTQRAGEVLKDSVAKAALGSSAHRKATKRVRQGAISPGRQSRSRVLKTTWTTLPSPSH